MVGKFYQFSLQAQKETKESMIKFGSSTEKAQYTRAFATTDATTRQGITSSPKKAATATETATETAATSTTTTPDGR